MTVEIDIPVSLVRLLRSGLSLNIAQRPRAADWILTVRAARVVLARRRMAVPSRGQRPLPSSSQVRVPDWVRPQLTKGWIAAVIVLALLVIILLIA